ncbi:MAG: peptide chain release factor 3 [Anderseniella sp.]|jgi:peptide chain release factor 3|nr:peptide chain release factor 3 [Anderseniella sp.]
MGSDHLTRRTFAIISHPDAGKTTLTEKLLLAGGAIRLAGAVRARGDQRRARSDWMKIEQDRGISVTSSVMTFDYDGHTCNLLDTPGHEDFSEDTYRTLTAVDSAIMVIDAAKGIETQTRKLFEVCRLRDIPIVTFVNKVDREGRDGFELLDEIQEMLALDVSPQIWPVGMGSDFFGCFDLRDGSFQKAERRGGGYGETVQLAGPGELARSGVPGHIADATFEAIELAQAGYTAFEKTAYLEGHLTPVIFGSALNGFSVSQLLDFIVNYAPSPRPSPAEPRTVSPDEDKVSGFVFKVQANMDKNHRDRVAFMRICSGDFRRGMKLRQVRTGKDLLVHSPIFFLAQDREIAEEAVAGDVIGIPNHGTVRVGDTFTEGEVLRFTGLPAFAPEVLRRVRLGDMTRVKQMRAALEDLAEEGLIQVFQPEIGSQWIVGVVGVLQLDVMASRAEQEYGVRLDFENAPYEMARWIASDDPAALNLFRERNRLAMATDRDGSPVFLAKGQWELDYAARTYDQIRFLKTKELQ